MQSDLPVSPTAVRNTGRLSLLLALAQSICTAVLTASSLRVIIGLSALADAAGVYEPATGFHQDWIRIPMLILATIGSLINLAVIAWIRYLRSRPSAQWRRRELNAKEKRSERLQIALALITLVLVALETWTHTIVFRHGTPPAVHASMAAPLMPDSKTSSNSLTRAAHTCQLANL